MTKFLPAPSTVFLLVVVIVLQLQINDLHKQLNAQKMARIQLEVDVARALSTTVNALDEHSSAFNSVNNSIGSLMSCISEQNQSIGSLQRQIKIIGGIK